MVEYRIQYFYKSVSEYRNWVRWPHLSDKNSDKLTFVKIIKPNKEFTRNERHKDRKIQNDSSYKFVGIF